MSARSLLNGLTGVHAVVVGDEGGRLVDAAGDADLTQEVVPVAAAVFDSVARLGDALSLGGCQYLTIRGQGAVRVIGRQRGAIAVAQGGAKDSTAEIERRLRTSEWAPGVERSGPAARGPVFGGDLQLFNVPEVLEFLRSSQRTGTLVCTSAGVSAVVSLRRGKVIAARSPSAPTLAEHFRDQGALSAPDLRAVAAHPEDFSDALVAHIVIDRRLANADAVRGALAESARTAIRELVGWRQGRFAFEPAPSIDAPVAGFDIEIDTQELLLGIFAAEDERSKAR